MAAAITLVCTSFELTHAYPTPHPSLINA